MCFHPFRGVVAIVPLYVPCNEDASIYFKEKSASVLGDKHTDQRGAALMNYNTWFGDVAAVACMSMPSSDDKQVCAMQRITNGNAKLRFTVRNMKNGSSEVNALSVCVTKPLFE